MANIKKHLENIKGALFGKDVRSSIHDGIDAINKEVEGTTEKQNKLGEQFKNLVINEGNSNAEVAASRGSHDWLPDRLDNFDSQLEHIANPENSSYILFENFENDDISKSIEDVVDYAIKNNINKIIFKKKKYILNRPIELTLTGNVEIIIEGNGAKFEAGYNTSDYMINLVGVSDEYFGEHFVLKNLTLIGNYISKGLNINEINFWCLDNVLIYNNRVGLRMYNTYYGNITSNCRFGGCLTSILFDNGNDGEFSEVNTIELGSVSIICTEKDKARYGSGNDTIGVEIATQINAVKFNGLVIEFVDYGFKTSSINVNQFAITTSIFNIESCYFEKIQKYNIYFDEDEANKALVSRKVTISNCRFFQFDKKPIIISNGEYVISNNESVKLGFNKSSRMVKVNTDICYSDLDLTYTPNNLILISLGIPKSTNEYDLKNILSTDKYVISSNRERAIESELSLYYKNSNNDLIKNNIMLHNTKNLTVWEAGQLVKNNPVINGDDGNYYMLSTKNGDSLNLIKVNNHSRLFKKEGNKTAIWLYRFRNDLEEGTEYFCEDIEKTLVLKNNNWYEKEYDYLAIGSTLDFINLAKNNPINIWWQPAWNVQCNCGLYWQSEGYYSMGFDTLKNNDPKDNVNVVKVYGKTSERPIKSINNGIYYDTDKNIHYIYLNSEWVEYTPYF